MKTSKKQINLIGLKIGETKNLDYIIHAKPAS